MKLSSKKGTSKEKVDLLDPVRTSDTFSKQKLIGKLANLPQELRDNFRSEMLAIPFEFLVQLARAHFRGWSSVGKRALIRLHWLHRQTNPIQYAFLTSSLILTTLALFPWIGYEINLIGPESITIGSNLKTLFALPGMVGILMLMTDLPFRKRIYFTIFGISAIVYITGLVLPNPIHTSMTLREEYRFLPWMYVYGLLSVITPYLGRKALNQPLFRIKRYLTPEIPAYLDPKN